MSDRGQSPPRTSLQSSRPAMSRPTSLRIPNPDVFSDDYAVEGSPDISPVDSIQRSSENLPISHPRTSIALPPTAHTHFSRPTSTSKRVGQDGTSIPHRAVSSVSRTESTAQRTSSTSSRFSMPRAQSPYIGSTGPSHPYAMYPQVTRASSIASESTIRPLERPFVASAGPEHPYAMYPQNTLSEDDDPIPLGFPGMGARYQTRAAGHDIADLVGSDGHVEELPPYTRYAEHALPKESPSAPEAAMAVPMSPMSQHSDSGVELNVGAAREAGEQNEKRGWKAKAQRRVCLGLPLWAILIVVIIIILATCLGGVIGGVVGTDQGADLASSHATKTVYLDGVPAPTYTPSPSSCPEGPFVFPIANDSRAVNTNNCIQNPLLSRAWGCLPPDTSIGFTFDWTSGEGPETPQVTFDDYSMLQPNFPFGPQPPNLTKIYTLGPYTDRDDQDLGPALFFWTFYSKLTILPGWALDNISKRSLSYTELVARDAIYSYPYLSKMGEEVWSCAFDNSIFEFFIYPHQTSSVYAAETASTSSCLTSVTPIPGAPSTPPTPPTASPSPTDSQWSNPSTWASAAATSGWSDSRKRDYGYMYQQVQTYPRLVKVLEKRKSSGNAPAYCTKMMIQPDWTLQPVPGVQPILVDEVDYTSASTTGNSRVRLRRDSMSGLQSNCACEYFNF